MAARHTKPTLQGFEGKSAGPTEAARFSSQEILPSPRTLQAATVLPSEPAVPISDVSGLKPKTKAKLRYLKRKTERRKARTRSVEKPTKTREAKERGGQASEERLETPEERYARKHAAKEGKRVAKELKRRQEASDLSRDSSPDRKQVVDVDEAMASNTQHSGRLSGSEAEEEMPTRKRRKREGRDGDVVEDSMTNDQVQLGHSGDMAVGSIADSKASPSSSSSPPPLQRFSLPKKPAGPSATLLAELAIPFELSNSSAQLVSPSLTVHVDSLTSELSKAVRDRLKGAGISDFFAGTANLSIVTGRYADSRALSQSKLNSSHFY
jgi:hypothetical protein